MVSYNFCPTLRDSSGIILLLKVCGDGQEGSYECVYLILLIKIVKMGSNSRNKKHKKGLGGHMKTMSTGNGL